MGAHTRPDVAAEVSTMQATRPRAMAGEGIWANKVVMRVKATSSPVLESECSVGAVRLGVAERALRGREEG